MKMMKSILAIAVLSSVFSLLAARPVVETERMKKENAYEGVWLEKHHDEALKVAFSTNGWMIVDYRGLQQLFRWKSNGKGLIELAPGEKPEKTVMKLKYLPKQDIMDCGFEGKTTQLDFTGLLAFKSTELSKEHADALREATAKHERYREERFERLKKSGDPRLKCVTNLIEQINPNRLLQDRLCIETVDLNYPQIRTGCLVSDNFIFITVIYGAHENRQIELHEIHKANGVRLTAAAPYIENEVGIPRAVAKRAMSELADTGTNVSMLYWQYGEGKSVWYEEGIDFFVRKENYDKTAEVLSRYFSDSRPRYIMIDQAEYVEPEAK